MLTDDQILALAIPSIKSEESCDLKGYRDSLGLWTVGWGHHDASVGPQSVWTQAKADNTLIADCTAVLEGLDAHIPWWRSLDVVRASTLAEMAFQEGVGGLMSFHNALAATHAGNWQLAHDQFLASKWGRQTPARANREAQRILTGINNVPEKYDS